MPIETEQSNSDSEKPVKTGTLHADFQPTKWLLILKWWAMFKNVLKEATPNLRTMDDDSQDLDKRD